MIPPLTPAQRLSADRRFNQLVNHFDAPDSSYTDYDRVKLVRLTYEYARSEESKGYFLRAFFESAGLEIDAEQEDIDLTDAATQAKLRDSLVNFAEYLFENFFLPLKSSTKKTPQPSPASHSAVQRAQGGEGQNFLGTPERVLHGFFGDFQIYFEPVDQEPHTYRINTFIQDIMEYEFPITRTLYLTESRTIDPPSPRLLSIHNAIAHILHLSAAGEYIDRILQDLEEHGVREHGSTELDRFVKLRLNGWSVSEVNGYHTR
ncbi:hypothetical protein QQZ08_012413 [Neonectria magnoliae]|uniref:HNH nuclease domain-containing protein n=1 Tax=Neonectria magnoliae TaxID=2732573 RepID=A0ABR1H252_9HYPO